MKTLTVSVCNQYCTTTDLLSDTTLRVTDRVGNEIQPVSQGYYEMSDDVDYLYIRAICDGYITQTDSAVPTNTDTTVNIQLVPVYTLRYVWPVPYNDTTDSKVTQYTATLYHKINGEWQEVETCYANNGWGYCWFNDTDHVSGVERKIEATSPDYFPHTEYLVDTQERAKFDYTWPVTTTAIVSDIKDKLTGDTLTADTITYYYQQKIDSAPAWPTGWTQVTNPHAAATITSIYGKPGFLFTGKNNSKNTRVKVSVTKNGYDDAEAINEVGKKSTPIKDVLYDVEMQRSEHYASLTVEVLDNDKETQVPATVTVQCDQTQEVITPVEGVYEIVKNLNYTYTITAAAPDYETQSVTIEPTDSMDEIEQTIRLQKIYRKCDLYVSVYNDKGEQIEDPTITVYEDGVIIAPTDDHYELIYNDERSYDVTVSADGYYSKMQTITPTSADDIHMTETLQKIPVYARLYVTVIDVHTHEAVLDAEIAVLDNTTGEYVTPAGQYWELLAEENHEYIIEIQADGFYDYESEPFGADTEDDINEICEMEREPLYKPLTVDVIDAETGDPLTANVVVRNETKSENVPVSHDGKYYLEVNVYQDQYYKIYVTKRGYKTYNSEIFPALDTTPIYKLVSLEVTLEPFATFDDLKNRTGVDYNYKDKERIEYLLDDVSNLIRHEGRKCGVDVDERVRTDRIYASVVKTVTCDVTQRVFRQSLTGDAMSQESQSALGYSWSGTFAVPGGGTAMSLMRNEMNILGFNPQTIGVIELC